jgi:hypothetical protein
MQEGKKWPFLKADPRFDPRTRTLFAATQVTIFTRVNACCFRVTACFCPKFVKFAVGSNFYFQNDFCLQWNR